MGSVQLCSGPKRHLWVHLRRAELISETEICLHLSRSDFLAQALHLAAVCHTLSFPQGEPGRKMIQAPDPNFLFPKQQR